MHCDGQPHCPGSILPLPCLRLTPPGIGVATAIASHSRSPPHCHCPTPLSTWQEGECFAKAASLDTHKGLVHIFFAQRATKKVRGVTDAGA